MTKMFENDNWVITGRHDALLVGIARLLTDFCYACCLSDLAVGKEYQHMGVGKTHLF